MNYTFPISQTPTANTFRKKGTEWNFDPTKIHAAYLFYATPSSIVAYDPKAVDLARIVPNDPNNVYEVHINTAWFKISAPRFKIFSNPIDEARLLFSNGPVLYADG